MKDDLNVYLHKLQKDSYLAAGVMPKRVGERLPDFSSLVETNPIEGTPEDQLNQMRRDLSGLKVDDLSPYEDVGSILILNKLIGTLSPALKKNVETIKTGILFGTLPTGRLNAAALYHESSKGFIIVFQSGLFHFLNLFIKAIITAVPKKIVNGVQVMSFADPDEIRKSIDEKKVSTRIFDLLNAYLVSGNPAHARPYTKYIEHSDTISEYLTICECFILGHEYGHIYSDHFDKGNLTNFMLPIREEMQVNVEYEQEHEADLFSLLLLRDTFAAENNVWDLGKIFLSIELFFAANNLIEKSLEIIEQNSNYIKPQHETHPSVAARRKVIVNKLAGENEELIQAFGHISGFVELITEQLLSSVSKHLKKIDVTNLSSYWSLNPSKPKKEGFSILSWWRVSQILNNYTSEDHAIAEYYSEEGLEYSIGIASTLLDNLAHEDESIRAFCNSHLSVLDMTLCDITDNIIDALHSPVEDRVQNTDYMLQLVKIDSCLKDRFRMTVNKVRNTKLRNPSKEVSTVDKKISLIMNTGRFLFELSEGKDRNLRKLSADFIKNMGSDKVVTMIFMGLIDESEEVQVRSFALLHLIDPSLEEHLKRDLQSRDAEDLSFFENEIAIATDKLNRLVQDVSKRKSFSIRKIISRIGKNL